MISSKFFSKLLELYSNNASSSPRTLSFVSLTLFSC
jgi:hypothetical protein